MFALAELSAMVLVAPVTPCGRIAQQIARCYLEAVCDCWRDGETERSRAFHLRLTRFRTAAMPLRPLRPSDAVSPHGGGGRGIAWYELPDAAVGYIAGVPEGYVIPLSLVADLISATEPVRPNQALRIGGEQYRDQLVMRADRAIAVVS